MNPYDNGFIRGEQDAGAVLREQYEGHLYIETVLPTRDMLPLTIDERKMWLTGYTHGMRERIHNGGRQADMVQPHPEGQPERTPGSE